MVPYKNSAGNSGVVAYDISDDRIAVQFIGGDIYVYSYASAGKRNVEQMKKLALAGNGLSTFISRVVRDKYE
ncbi:hypothetical protein [Mucilaginibacter myungsuensis]|uniref:Uncharacterized protein n=1 Tax=Mucilaginibacter myungsuensis TaxID=649104 RepID=A0A929KYQ3_9SPHI|nr:hypothetical protein [Mucilaginibacter myungsuensis]MBE9661050.1 hypothetical protein [Mucilaginibacter myungsuensis]MDN3597194.1 hypothetical protein [Mucilaginibacter myungsuensis]